MNDRVESDTLGDRTLGGGTYHGIQTERAIENFSVSSHSIAEMPDLICSLAMVKKAAALTNASNGELSQVKADAIAQACDEVIAGDWRDEFVVDVFQGGAGTSTNMNMNEVIANRALELMGHSKGDYARLHPTNDVNRSQSTNDSYATAVRLSLHAGNQRLQSSLEQLQQAFERQAVRHMSTPKLGRTQLQDAVAMTVGAELQAYAVTIAEDILQASQIGELLLDVNLGGTAIGSGLGASPAYSKRILANLASVTGLPVKRSRSLYEASWDMGAFVLYSGLMKLVAVKLSKIANDLRLLASGPNGGIAEYVLPARQAGSSLMPGKVNPVIPEMMNQVCFKAFGADTTVTFAAEAGQLQLNAMEPLIVWTLSETLELMVQAVSLLRIHCVDGIEINAARCNEHLQRSTALATHLVPHIGYDEAAQLAKDAIVAGVPFSDYIADIRPDLVHILEQEGL